MFEKWTKTIFGVGFALLFCFLCVGYAALQDELTITGTVSVEGQDVYSNRLVRMSVAEYAQYYNGSLAKSRSVEPLTVTTVVFDRRANYPALSAEVMVPVDDMGSGGVLMYADGSTGTLYFLHNDNNTDRIKAPVNCAGLFANSGVEAIYFNNMFDTADVTDMSSMFAQCNVSTLDLSGFDTGSCANMQGMFSGCTLLQTIWVSDAFVTSAVSNGADMFSGCISLVGGYGTAYSAEHVGVDYAHIDTADSYGYFTRIGALAMAARPAPAAEVALDAEWALDMSVTAQLDEDALRLTITPDEGYQLPESVNLAFGESSYTVYTTEEKRSENPAGIGFDPIDNTITVAAVLLPGGSFDLTVTGEAVAMPEPTPEPTPTPEVTPTPTPEPTPAPVMTLLSTEAKNLTVQITNDGIDKTLCLKITPEDGYLLPESFTVSFGGADYIIYTAAERSGDNPELMGFDQLTNTLTIHESLLPTGDFSLIITGTAVAVPVPTPDVTPTPEPTPAEDSASVEPSPTPVPADEPTEPSAQAE